MVACEKKVGHCKQTGVQTECEWNVTESRTDTTSWDNCTLGRFGNISAEAAAQVCRRIIMRLRSKYEVTTPRRTPHQLCQKGEYIEVDGKMYVHMNASSRLYEGRRCQLQACPLGWISSDDSSASGHASANPIAAALVYMLVQAVVIVDHRA